MGHTIFNIHDSSPNTCHPMFHTQQPKYSKKTKKIKLPTPMAQNQITIYVVTHVKHHKKPIISSHRPNSEHVTPNTQKPNRYDLNALHLTRNVQYATYRIQHITPIPNTQWPTQYTQYETTNIRNLRRDSNTQHPTQNTSHVFR